MSNVLIGIIGVILFIGLALAGALILGGDFLAASSSSKATAAMAQGRQIMHAVSMYELKTGKRFLYSTDGVRSAPTDLVPRFLKTATTANAWHFHSQYGGGVYAAADLVPSEVNEDICLEVQRQAGQVPGDAASMTTTSLTAAQIAAVPMGCTLQVISGEDRYVLFVS